MIGRGSNDAIDRLDFIGHHLDLKWGRGTVERLVAFSRGPQTRFPRPTVTTVGPGAIRFEIYSHPTRFSKRFIGIIGSRVFPRCIVFVLFQGLLVALVFFTGFYQALLSSDWFSFALDCFGLIGFVLRCPRLATIDCIGLFCVGFLVFVLLGFRRVFPWIVLSCNEID